MTLRSTPLLALSAAAIAAFGLIADPAMAGKGDNGNSGGDRGNSGGDRGNSGNRGGKTTSLTTKSQSGGNGTLASELKKANGAIHASDTAWANASGNGVPGIARTYAEAQAGLDGFEGDLEQLKLDKEALEKATSVEDYEQMIANLSLADFPDASVDGFDEVAYDDELKRLEGLRDDAETLTEAEISDELKAIETAMDEYDGNETAKDDALKLLIGERELSPEAMAELENRVQEYLASDAYLATVETEAEVTVVEEVPTQ